MSLFFKTPIVLCGYVPRIENKNTILNMYLKTVEGSKAFCAELCHVDGHTQTCIVVIFHFFSSTKY
jgi:hypothetical protein